MNHTIDWDMIALEYMEHYDKSLVDTQSDQEYDFLVQLIRAARPTFNVFDKRRAEVGVRKALASCKDSTIEVEELMPLIEEAMESLAPVELGWSKADAPEPLILTEAQLNKAFSQRKKSKNRDEAYNWSSPHNVFKMGHQFANQKGSEAFDPADRQAVTLFKSIIREFNPTRSIMFWGRLSKAITSLAEQHFGAHPFKETVEAIVKAMKGIKADAILNKYHRKPQGTIKETTKAYINQVIEDGRALEAQNSARDRSPGDELVSVDGYLLSTAQLSTYLTEGVIKGDIEYLEEFKDLVQSEVDDADRKYLQPAVQSVEKVAVEALSRQTSKTEEADAPPMPPYGLGVILPDDQPHWNRVYTHVEELKSHYRYVKREPTIMDGLWEVWLSELDPNDPDYEMKKYELRQEYERRFNLKAVPM